jgi:hypothetical protein
MTPVFLAAKLRMAVLSAVLLASISSYIGPCPARAEDEEQSPYAENEPVVTRAPGQPESTALQGVSRVLDVVVSPVGPDVAALVQNGAGRQSLIRWKIGSGAAVRIPVPPQAALSSLAWRPAGGKLFAAGRNAIFALAPGASEWSPTPVWLPSRPVERLLAGPRPFQPGYRLFFAQPQTNGKRWIGSITERGEKFYYVTAENPPVIAPAAAETSPNTQKLPDARPAAFHPAGNLLLIADASGCFFKKPYASENWADAQPLKECGGEIAYSPNGAVLMRWRRDKPGVELIDLQSGARRAEATEISFVSAPAFTPDGRGLVGAAKTGGGRLELRYQPIDMPLADVVNAWMFLESTQDEKLFSTHGGLFRPMEGDQLYKLYDSENYYCGGYDSKQPARPYFVTTDIFWEVYGAAYEGVFMTAERRQAMPAFKSLVDGASRELAASAPKSRMAGAFAAASAVLANKASGNAEAAKIIAGVEAGKSDVLGEETDYRVFAPRGHYTKDDAAKAYFRAARYLGSIALTPEDLTALRSLSPESRAAAMKWIDVYRSFIAPSRAPLAWDEKRPLASYVSRPQKDPKLFPLSWGWDNEIFDAVIHHPDRPMTGPNGPRLLPTGLDLAAALGNPLANSVLAELGQFQEYPELKARLAAQGERFRASAASDGSNLYARWIRALAAQWAAEAETPVKGPLWSAKRLQTGLASWATLRHATVLVNDLAAAECGEAGFEAIIMRPPRGYVEPDPATFAAIAAQFDATIKTVRQVWRAGDPLGDGIARRLEQSRDQARHFGAIAGKELKGEPLSAKDYEDILYVGRAAEHNFLVFFSLQSEENALSTPDPIAKVAEVAGGSATGWLEAAVGMPLEWDQITPSFGRREIVKGAVYSYYEFVSNRPINDEEWRAKAASAPRPSWVTPYMSEKQLSCPPKQP